MTASTALQYDTIWLKPADYEVSALNSRLTARIPELQHALKTGLPAYPDGSRQDFYDIELDNGWAYIHVHEERRTVYLIAYSQG